ncbi:MAG: 30S ribosomal protein S8 [Planctomycetes bacterium]|nr:30S ribosomal protein S8 [Planctomycetota bacterium]
MMTDPVADLLTRIRNANAIHAKSVSLPASRMKVGIAEVLKDEGFIESYAVEEAKPCSQLRVQLKYGPDGEQVIRSISRISTPGCRVYSKARELTPVLRGLGISILSTPLGILSDRQARSKNSGGEVLARVY